MNPIIFGCVDIGNQNDLPASFFTALDSADILIVENLYMWEEFSTRAGITFDKEVVSFNLPDFKGKHLNELPENVQEEIFNHQQDILRGLSEAYHSGKSVLILSDEGSSILADFGGWVRHYCIATSIEFKVLAGPSALINSLTTSKILGDVSPFIFYGPVFSTERTAALIENINKLSTDFFGVVFLIPKTAAEIIKSISDEFGNLDASLCINLTLDTENVISGTLKDVLEYLESMGENYYELKHKISLVFKKGQE